MITYLLSKLSKYQYRFVSTARAIATATLSPPQAIYALWERTTGSHGRDKLKPAHSPLALDSLGLLIATHSRNQTTRMLGKSYKTL